MGEVWLNVIGVSVVTGLFVYASVRLLYDKFLFDTIWMTR